MLDSGGEFVSPNWGPLQNIPGRDLLLLVKGAPKNFKSD